MDIQKQSLTCSNCGAPMAPVPDKDYFLCSYCGTYYFPEASRDGIKIIGEPATHSCPLCKMLLVTALVEDIHIEACSNCRGVLVNQDQLAYIINTLRLSSSKTDTILPFNKSELDHERFCQTCGLKMDTHLYGGGGNVVIDVCNQCRLVWFDYGELNRVITAPEFGIDDRW